MRAVILIGNARRHLHGYGCRLSRRLHRYIINKLRLATSPGWVIRFKRVAGLAISNSLFAARYFLQGGGVGNTGLYQICFYTVGANSTAI
jgi:hypothetical protein